MTKNAPEQSEEPKGGFWLNAGRTVFLVVVLVVAWFVLEWLFGRSK